MPLKKIKAHLQQPVLVKWVQGFIGGESVNGKRMSFSLKIESLSFLIVARDAVSWIFLFLVWLPLVRIITKLRFCFDLFIVWTS